MAFAWFSRHANI
jgi:hypothetical protein